VGNDNFGGDGGNRCGRRNSGVGVSLERRFDERRRFTERHARRLVYERLVLKTIIPSAFLFLLPSCLLGVPELENAKVEGTWSMSVKNEANGCMFEEWAPGSVNAFEIKLEQFGEKKSDVNAQLQGLVGLAFWAGIGTSTLTGKIDGEELDLTLLGTKDEVTKGCVFRREIHVTAQVQKDRFREGRIVHMLRATPGGSCGPLNGCQTMQTFDGTRIDLPDPSEP
jgi:hypothetical protein